LDFLLSTCFKISFSDLSRWQPFEANKKRHKDLRGLNVASFADYKGKAWAKCGEMRRSSEVIEKKEFQEMVEE